MKTRGALAVLVLAGAVVYFLFFAKTAGREPLREDVRRFQRTKAEVTGFDLGEVERAVLSYQASQGALPDSLEALKAARLLAGAPLDPWGKEVRYERLAEDSFRLTSAGPDGAFDTADDVVKDG